MKRRKKSEKKSCVVPFLPILPPLTGISGCCFSFSFSATVKWRRSRGKNDHNATALCLRNAGTTNMCVCAFLLLEGKLFIGCLPLTRTQSRGSRVDPSSCKIRVGADARKNDGRARPSFFSSLFTTTTRRKKRTLSAMVSAIHNAFLSIEQRRRSLTASSIRTTCAFFPCAH